jgi:adenylylsulfate kinase
MIGAIVWLTGLPASGKSTLANHVRQRLADIQRPAVILDGDAVRTALGAHSYGSDDRDTFYRTLARLAELIASQGVIVLVPATAPRRAHREAARRTGYRFFEVWVRASQTECEARDVKGLYAAAHRGEITALPGVNVAYEPPENADVIADGGNDDEAAAAIVRMLT